MLKNCQAEVKLKWQWADDQRPQQQQGARGAHEEEDHVDPTFRDLIAPAINEAPITNSSRVPLSDVPNNPSGFISLWKACIYAPTINEFETAWEELIRRFAEEQEPAVSYILTTYFPWRKHFCVCYTSQNRNFGIRVTSRTESSHKEIKSYLLNSTAELRLLATRVEQLVKDQQARYAAAEAEQAARQLEQYRGKEMAWGSTVQDQQEGPRSRDPTTNTSSATVASRLSPG